MIKIKDREITKNGYPFIIAEVGINHNGSLKRAFDMIKVAKDAGVDCVKFQTFKADEFVGDPNQMFTYKSQGKEVTESMLGMFKRYEFTDSEWKEIKNKCDDEGIIFMSTPQNKSDLDLLLKIGIPAIKIGSDDFTNIPLLKDYAKTGLPIILSCGMADISEVYQAMEVTGALEGYPVVLLVCTSEYPTPVENVNILRLKTLRNAFEDLILGFSDHTQGPIAASLAVSLGATVFEKHFTLSKDLEGPDHWFSEDPETLKVWANTIRESYKMLGSSLVKPTSAEKSMRILARRSIIAIQDIKAGDNLNEINIGLRRPGNGILPVFFPNVLGKTSNKFIQKGTLIKWEDMIDG
ncbi:MAG TPA: N-acetylneuraminate synthase family protein [Ferruginibacter sp.]|jgi:N,N'-diacetyllegionaminate synthase|nr:N-acetylneuraminate synthase family protein [Ferruginibacter sp.]